MLKPFHGDLATAAAILTNTTFNQQLPIAPLVILATRRTSNAITEVLVQWQGLPPDDATWENWDALRDEFHLEDKVLPHRAWNDTEEQSLQTNTTEEQANTIAAT